MDSNSPPPEAPATQTPGVRALTLNDVFHGALASALKSCSYANFASCFPTPAQYVPESLDGLHRDFIGRLNEFCKNEFQTLLQDRNVVPSLNELDALIEEARKRKNVADTHVDSAPATMPPHMLQPSSLLSAHLASFLSTQSNDYTQRVARIQAENTALAEVIATQRTDIGSLVGSLEAVVFDLESACLAMRSGQTLEPEEDLTKATIPSAERW